MSLNIEKKPGALGLSKESHPEKATLIVSGKLKAQIKHICDAHKIEWCGILLYKIDKGNTLDPEDIVIKVDYIFITGFGTHSFTEGQYNDALLKMMDIADLDDYSYGMVHSHGEMNTFFSGTDVAQMDDNYSMFNPFYLSLVVNNKGSYSARICWEEVNIIGAHQSTKKVMVNNKFEEIVVNTAAKSKKVLYTMDLNVLDEILIDNITVKSDTAIYMYNGSIIYDAVKKIPKWFKERFKEIRDKHTSKAQTEIGRTFAPTQYELPFHKSTTEFEIIGKFQIKTDDINRFINHVLTKGQNKLNTFNLVKLKTYKASKVLNLDLGMSDLVNACMDIFPKINPSELLPYLLDEVYERILDLENLNTTKYDIKLISHVSIMIDELNTKLIEKWKVENDLVV